MKSPHMKSRVAASVSKYLIQQTDKESQAGAHEHLEYFFHSMPHLSSGTKKSAAPTSSFLPATKSNQFLKKTSEPPISLSSSTADNQVSFIKYTLGH